MSRPPIQHAPLPREPIPGGLIQGLKRVVEYDKKSAQIKRLVKTIKGDGFTIIDGTDAFLRSAENAVERAIARGTLKVEKEAELLVSQSAGPTKTHPDNPPSEPYSPPHLRTGTLARSIESETFERGRNFYGRVGTNLKYGLWLEIGTKDGTLLPRPYLRPALDTHRKVIVKDIRAAFKKL